MWISGANFNIAVLIVMPIKPARHAYPARLSAVDSWCGFLPLPNLHISKPLLLTDSARTCASMRQRLSPGSHC
jgi:hypothetical protein